MQPEKDKKRLQSFTIYRYLPAMPMRRLHFHLRCETL